MRPSLAPLGSCATRLRSSPTSARAPLLPERPSDAPTRRQARELRSFLDSLPSSVKRRARQTQVRRGQGQLLRPIAHVRRRQAGGDDPGLSGTSGTRVRGPLVPFRSWLTHALVTLQPARRSLTPSRGSLVRARASLVPICPPRHRRRRRLVLSRTSLVRPRGSHVGALVRDASHAVRRRSRQLERTSSTNEPPTSANETHSTACPARPRRCLARP